MTHQLMVTLSDQEYDALKAEATKNGKQLETLLHEILHTISTRQSDTLLHEILTQQFQTSSTGEKAKRPLTGREFMEQQYHEGKLLNLPARRRLTQEEQAERQHLAEVFSSGKMASDMVIEDRGPY
jgi:ribonuclease HIII